MVNHVSTAVLLIIGVFAGIEDIREGKIRHRWIIFGLVSGSILFLLSVLGWGGGGPLPTIRNFVIATLVAFGLWHHGMWSGGDAKLFATFAFLIPVETYTAPTSRWFPALDFLINTIAPALFIVMVRIMAHAWSARGSLRSIRLPAAIRDVKRWKELLAVFAGFCVLFVLMRWMNDAMGRLMDRPLAILLIMIFFRPLLKLLKRPAAGWVSLSALIGILLLYLWFGPDTNWKDLVGILRGAGAMMVLIWIIMRLAQAYTLNREVKRIRTFALKTGDLLTDETARQIAADLGTRRFYADGVSDAEADAIRRFYPPDHEIGIYRVIPFAPMAAVGVVITMLLGTSIFRYFAALVGVIG